MFWSRKLVEVALVAPAEFFLGREQSVSREERSGEGS